MKRLAFKIPEYAPRTIWTSPHAREIWQPRIAQITQVWEQVERLLVARSARPSALQNISPENLPGLLKEVAKDGLVAVPLAQVPRVNGYQAASHAREAGDWDYRVAITSFAHVAEWTEAWATNNNDAIGKLLGYPECCRKFFNQIWVAERWFDTTWPMAANTPEGKHLIAPAIEGISIPGNLKANILWRWHGVRTVSHLPCSFGCKASEAMGEATLQVMASSGFAEEADWLREILSWPVEWSALHGIAEIRTPISRTSVATDATAGKVSVRYQGTRYPAEGAQGTGFPHIGAAQTRSAPVLQMSNPADNGFSSREAMNEAHRRLLEPLKMPYKTILDLGCGDGVLLSKIAATRRVGVEIDPRIAKLAEYRIDRVVVGDVTDPALVTQLLAEEKPDLVIAQNVRNPPDTLRVPFVLSYSYDSGEPPCLLKESDDLLALR